MRAITITCLLLTVSAFAAADMPLHERIDILWGRAVRQTDFAKWDAAVETGRHAVEIAPRSAEAWALLAYAHWMHPRGLAYLAQGQAQRALGLDPDSARARMVSGLVIPAVTAPPDFDRAISELTRAVERDPTLAEAWSWMGMMHYDGGDAEAAIPDIRRAIELDPQYYQWRLHLAEVLLALGQVDEAVADNRRALELAFSPFTEMLARNNLAWSLCLLNPDDPELQQEALNMAARLAADLPQDPEILDTLGTAELLFGDPARAEQALRTAIEGGNNSWSGLAYALALQGETEEARACLAEFSELYISGEAEPEHPWFAGLAWEALGEPQIAGRIFAAATAKWPDHPWSDEMRAWLAEN